MFFRTLPLSLTGFGLALLAFTPSAQAHIRLLEPTPRYDITGFDVGIKSCPCGLGSSNRTCNMATDASDPDRGTRVSRFEAGSSIVLRFDEYVDHVGTFRVAFDDDGADVTDFNAHILVPMVPDPSGGMGNTGQGATWEIPVTLPDMICDNCTLQLVQAMNNDTVNPVADPTNVSSYYTCVDLELVAPGTLGEDGDPDETDGMEPDEMGAGEGTGGTGTMTVGSLQPDNPGSTMTMTGNGMTGNGMTGNGMTNSTTPMAMTPGMSLDGMMPGSSGASSGGCSFGSRSKAPSFAALAAASVLGLLAARRRKPARAQARG